MQPIIVGIDPGTTSAYALLDFEGKLVSIDSKRNFSLSEMISSIFYQGDPILVATDKKDLPSFVDDFSRKLGAKPITPKYDMKKGEKKRIVKENGFIDMTDNAHEIDALASAIYAYNQYKPLIDKIKHELNKHNKTKLKDEILPLVLLENYNISLAMDLLEKEDEKTIKKVQKKRKRQYQEKKKLSKEQKQILLLKKQNLKFKQKIKTLSKELEQQKNKTIDIDVKTKKLLSFKEKRILFFEQQLKKKDLKIKNLRKKIQNLRDLIPRINESFLIKKLDNLSKEEFDFKSNKLNIKKNDVLLVKDLSVFSKSVVKKIKNKIKILIYNKKSNKLIKKDFLLLNKSIFNILETEDYAFVNKKKFDKLVEKVRKKKKFDKNYLKNMIEDYKKERKVF